MTQRLIFNSQRRQLIAGAAGAALLSASGQGLAAQREFEQLMFVCGFTAGGTVDQLARRVASKIPSSYAGSVLVDNRPGATGQLAVRQVSQQPANGSTVLVAPMVNLTLFPYTFKNLPYDPFNDFVILTAATQVLYGFSVGPMVPASVQSVQDYMAWVKTDPKHATCGVAGVVPTLIVLGLSKIAGVDIVPAMYKGGTPAAMDAMAGNVPSSISSLGDILPFLGEGKLRLLALASNQRDPLVADVPTFEEQGIAEMDHRLYYSFFVRADTFRDMVERHSAVLRAALAHPEVAGPLAQIGMEVVPADLQESAEITDKDRKKWAALVKRVGYEPV